MEEVTLGRGLPFVKKYWPNIEDPPSFTLKCQIFIPKPGDLLHESWNSQGKIETIQPPPFAAKDEQLQEASAAIKDYIDRTMPYFKQEMLIYHRDRADRLSSLKLTSTGPQNLNHLVFAEAVRFAIEAPKLKFDELKVSYNLAGNRGIILTHAFCRERLTTLSEYGSCPAFLRKDST